MRRLRSGAPNTNRTCDLSLRRRLLYPLSYRGLCRILAFAGAFPDRVPDTTKAGYAGLPGISGGAEGDRTLDLCIANAALSQLSYRPI